VLDGVGKCGRQLCCSSWLREFNPVTIKMAKQQNLPLNPPEISGVCGRLLCCLAYEADVYEDARKQLPKVGAAVMTPAGEGRVRRVQPLRETVTVRLDDGAMQDFPVTELELQGAKGGGRACSGCAMRRQPAPADEVEEDLDVPSDLMDLDETTPSSPPGNKRPRSKRNRNKPAG
jgi:cell fate regulator YaaT (PSP1 superfamily)